MKLAASGHELVSRAALEVMEKGGNAFDGIVAAGFVAAVAEPALTSLGGGGFLLAVTNTGDATLFDFFVNTPGRGRGGRPMEPHFYSVTVHFPGADQVFNIGLGSVAVPGCLKGYLHIHERLGRLPLEVVIAPAVRAASEGVRLNSHQAYFLKLLEPIMTATAEARAVYAPSGRYLQEGDILRNPWLAQFLQQLPVEGADAFYRGDVARAVVADMERGDGMLTLSDLSSYEVVEREPLRFRFKGREILCTPYPSMGGRFVAAQLDLLSQHPLSRDGWGGPAHLIPLAAVQTALEECRDQCRMDMGLEEVKGVLSGRLRAFFRGTTHVSVADDEGNCASMTTSNGEGSGYMAPGTGIMLNNMMGEDDLHPQGFHAMEAGERVLSMMTPMVIMEEGRARFVLGSGGSKRIRTAMVQAVVNLLEFSLPPKEAVEAPRIHFDGEVLQVEPGFPEGSVQLLEERWKLNLWKGIDVYFGGVHLVECDRAGAGDPRRGGVALAA